MTVDFNGRIGYLMFEYAILISVTERHGVIAVVPPNFDLSLVFEMTTPAVVFSENVVTVFKERDNFQCKFDALSNKINVTGVTASSLKGYFQSWKYFEHYEDELRKQLIFRKYLKRAATKFIVNCKEDLRLSRGLTPNVKITTIAVHVRRGDMVKDIEDHGHTAAPSSYLLKAMDYMTSLYGNGVVFIVASDDIPWCERTMAKIENKKIYFSKSNSAELDFAIIASSDHVIVTVGSFGWWGAWLANGTTLYYKDWPRKGSPLELQVDHEEYFPPRWIGLSG
ncbi:galactoside 2-alpha-L-fucosyltransferase SEC1-like [Tubulanus polymorphus]|uniref:galactoside 2-alpha-L-fucosyltransferase SEC1-like n=1 Tax=Tubulanus polymorphus TaxID=672921 RepID=UPI003DA571D6